MKPDPQGRGRKEAYCILRIWNESDEKRSRSMKGRLFPIGSVGSPRFLRQSLARVDMFSGEARGRLPRFPIQA